MLALEYDPEAERQAWIDYGMEQGIERGIDIGREQGIERGIDIGREKEKNSLVENFLRVNTPIEYIVAATGLTAEQIRKLADTNGGEHTLTNAILLDERDNVVTCTTAAHKGDTIKFLGGEIVCVEDIPIWHKVALKPIGAGEKIFKYGEIIGEAASDIAAGAWVSHENIFSVPRDYQCEFVAEVCS